LRNSRLENEILRRVDELVQCAMSVGLKDEPGREEQLARGIALVQEMGDLLLEVLEGREQHLQALLEQLIAQRLPNRRILHSFGNFSHDIQHIISNGVANYLETLKEKEQGEKEPAACNKEMPISSGLPGSAEINDNVYYEDEGPEPSDTSETLPKAIPGYVSNAPINNNQFSSTEETGVDIKNAAAYPEALADLNTSNEPATDSCPERTVVPGDTATEEIYPDPTDTAAESLPHNTDMETLRLALLQMYPGEEIINNYSTPYGKIPFYLPRLQLGFEPASLRHDWRYDFYCRQQGISIRVITEEELVNPIFLARRLRRKVYLHQLS